jgi:hypothetical protein
MTPRQRTRRSKRSARRKTGRAQGPPEAAAAHSAVFRAMASGEPGNFRNLVPAPAAPAAPKGPRSVQSGPGVAIRRLLVAGLLLGPALGMALGPLLAGDRLPLFESRISWQGPPPTAGDWPRAPRPGERAVTRTAGARTFLVARAATAAGAEALALELALPRLARSPELSEARAGRRAEWSAALLAGPRATLTPAGDCAARLRGWAEAWRSVAAPSAEAARAAGETGAAHHESPVPEESREVTRRALAADPSGLERALEREARVARARLFTRIGVLPAGDRAVAMGSWRRAWLTRAAEMDSTADALAARKPRIERELIALVAPVHALDAESRLPDPGVTLLLVAGSEPTAAHPFLWTWVVFAACGSVLAMLLATPLARHAARMRRARRAELMQRWKVAGEAFAVAPPAAASTIEARLQIVSGSRPRRVARVMRELAARFVAGGERVLVIDGGGELHLHDFFAAQSRLGFQECMRGEAPLLGIVQSGGLPGLYVLAHGVPSGLKTWAPLGPLLDHALAHFTRVLLALDPHLPRAAGGALAGRLMDGWWAGPDAKERTARRFSARLGIALQSVDPAVSEHEALESMVQVFARGARRDAAPAPAGAADAASGSQPELDTATLERLMEQMVREVTADPTPAPDLARLDELVEELARDAAQRVAALDAAAEEIAGATSAPNAEEPPMSEHAASEAAAAEHVAHETAASEAAAREAAAMEAVAEGIATATSGAIASEPPIAEEPLMWEHAASEAAAAEHVAHETAASEAAVDAPVHAESARELEETPVLAEAREQAEARELEETWEPESSQTPGEAPVLAEAPGIPEAREAAAAAASAQSPAHSPEEAPQPARAHEVAEPPAPADLPSLARSPAGELEPGLPAEPAPADAAREPAAEGEALVLESDPEVAERLRFLVWMRRLRDKSRAEVTHAG